MLIILLLLLLSNHILQVHTPNASERENTQIYTVLTLLALIARAVYLARMYINSLDFILKLFIARIYQSSVSIAKFTCSIKRWVFRYFVSVL